MAPRTRRTSPACCLLLAALAVVTILAAGAGGAHATERDASSLVGTWAVSGPDDETYYTFRADGSFTAYDTDANGKRCEWSGTYEIDSHSGYCLGKITTEHDECDTDAVGYVLECALTFESDGSFQTESEQGVWRFTAPGGEEPPRPSEDEMEQMLALVQWMTPFRFGKDLKEGDWVKYGMLSGDPTQTTEIRVDGSEKGGIWIVETITDGSESSEVRLLIDLGTMKVLDAFRIDEQGDKESAAPLDDERVAEIMEPVMAQGMPGMPQGLAFAGLEKCGTEEVSGPFGSLQCACLQAQITKESLEQIPPVQTEHVIAATRLYLSDEVPKLMPLQAAMALALLAPDDFGQVKNGLVKCPTFVLVSHSGQ
jgi:hypothetical protein